MHTAIVIAIADLRVRGIQDIVNSGIRQIPDRNAAGGDRDLAVIHINQQYHTVFLFRGMFIKEIIRVGGRTFPCASSVVTA